MFVEPDVIAMQEEMAPDVMYLEPLIEGYYIDELTFDIKITEGLTDVQYEEEDLDAFG